MVKSCKAQPNEVEASASAFCKAAEDLRASGQKSKSTSWPAPWKKRADSYRYTGLLHKLPQPVATAGAQEKSRRVSACHADTQSVLLFLFSRSVSFNQAFKSFHILPPFHKRETNPARDDEVKNKLSN
jgi:hypothetical protein